MRQMGLLSFRVRTTDNKYGRRLRSHRTGTSTDSNDAIIAFGGFLIGARDGWGG